MMMVYALKSFPNAIIEDTEAMTNLTIINLTLSKSLAQAQEKILMLYKNLQTLQVHINTEKPATYKENR